MTTNLTDSIFLIALAVIAVMPLTCVVVWLLVLVSQGKKVTRGMMFAQTLTMFTGVLSVIIICRTATLPVLPVPPESPLMKKARLERVVFNNRYGR